MSDHEEIESSVAAWVLGALDAEEADSVRSHAEGCPTCREVAGRLRRVVGALPLVVDEVSPPTRLRERVLAAAGASPRAGHGPVLERPLGREPKWRGPALIGGVGRRVAAHTVAAGALGWPLVGV